MAWRDLPSWIKGSIYGLLFVFIFIFLILHYRLGENIIEKYVYKLQGIKDNTNIIDSFIPISGAESRLTIGSKGYNLRELDARKSIIFLRLNFTERIEYLEFQYHFIKKGKGDYLILSIVDSEGNKQIIFNSSDENSQTVSESISEHISLKNYNSKRNVLLIFELKVNGETDSLISIDNLTLYPKKSFEIYQNWEDLISDSFFTLSECNSFFKEERKLICISERALLERNSSICHNINDLSLQANCYSSLALILENKEYCSFINGENKEYLINNCVMNIAINKSNINECNSLANIEFSTDKSWEDVCISLIALKVKNLALCEQTKTEIAKKDCYNLINPKT